MSKFDELEAAIAAERKEVQDKLKALQDQINGLDGITDEQKAKLIADIQAISEPAV